MTVRYTDEFKKAAVARLIAGERRVDLAKDLKVTKGALTTWKHELEGSKPTPKSKAAMHGNKRYPESIRSKALKRVADGEKAVSIERSLKLNKGILSYWKRMQNKNGHAAVLDFDESPKKKLSSVHDAIIFLKKAKKAMEKRGVAAAFDDPVCQFAMLALNTLEGKM